MKHWTTEYLGKPWVAGTRGPDSFDCWGLIHDIYKSRLGIELPKYSRVDPNEAIAYSRQITLGADNSNWSLLEEPKDMCVVAMSQNVKFLHHVGIYLPEDGGIIMHCHRTLGTVLDTEQGLKMKGWKRIEYYGYSN